VFENLRKRIIGNFLVLYENIDQILPNKLHATMHYKTGLYTCIQWTRVLYSVVITQQFNPHISQFNSH